uniref:WD_REPEATS_REGION domain-containing protein n=1 Tax=Trichuris muris TaxID=70415 RepID=A0A5S6R5F3_TRIMR
MGDSGKEVIKSQFITREGTYKLMTLSEYSRPSRVPLNPAQGNNVAGSAPVHVSFVTLPPDANESSSTDGAGSCREKICFNVGRELYVYNYEGVAKAADLSRPIDKRVYKGTYPTCHDFNQSNSSVDLCELLVGFSAGQIQLINPFKKDAQVNRLFNEDRTIDKSRVTCLKWIPGAKQHFLVSHASGYLYVYNVDLTCSCSLPSYQLFKQGECFAVHTCKTKTSRNPLYRWTICDGAVNEFQFSPDGRSLAVVSEDGYLRVFDYHTMELQGLMRSYFGGLLCVAWSPDAKYIATGGEDDLVSIYSVQDKRTVCRGQGHRSWVSKVAFDPYTSLVYCSGSIMHLDSDEDLRCATNNTIVGKCGSLHDSTNSRMLNRLERDSASSVSSLCSVTYRFGSVGHDTLLCLWDLSEDELKPPPPPQVTRLRSSVLFNHSPILNRYAASNPSKASSKAIAAASDKAAKGQTGKPPSSSDHNFSTSATTGRNKRLLMNFTGGASKNNEKSSSAANVTSGTTVSQETASALGSPLCPYLNDIPMIQPLISKKIAHERLSMIIFREDSIVTACQEGFICTWARPGHTANLTSQHNLNSPCLGATSASMLPGATMV